MMPEQFKYLRKTGHVSVVRGVAYFHTYRYARQVRDTYPGSRIVRYDRGYAVQFRGSGPYYAGV